MDLKFCNFCQCEHPVTKEWWYFKKDGKINWCKQQKKNYVDRKRNDISAKQKSYYKENKQKIDNRQKDYDNNNKDKISERKNKQKYKYTRNPNYHNTLKARLSRSLRSRVRGVLRNKKRPCSAVKDLGCTIEELKQHLESKFQEGMSWDNWGTHGWHIDHIVPLSSFDLTDRDQFVKACHYTNLQPLWAKDNLSKGSKVAIEYNNMVK
jgi:hypothetical protein